MDGPRMSYEAFKQFWNHYTQAFYNYNLAQFGQLSAHFRVPLPSPQKIKQIGDLHLKSFFDEVWSDSEMKFDKVPQESRPAYNLPNNNARHYHESNSLGSFDPNLFYRRQNIQQNGTLNSYSGGSQRIARQGPSQPLQIEQRPHQGFTIPKRQNIDQRKPYPYNNQMQQRPRGQSNSRGGYQNINRQNRMNGNVQKRSFTNLSDDESSQKACSSTTNSQSDRDINYNKKMAKDLGFGDDSGDEMCRMG